MGVTLAAAFEYQGLGLSVFPLSRETKRPLEGSHGFHDASTDSDQLMAWFAYTDHNIAMPMRPNGMIAVDVDPRNGGDVTFAAVEQRYGALPRDCVQRSASGGMHIIMRDPGGRPRGKLDHLGMGKGVDIKCNGYILVEPSTSSSGGRYEWVTLALPNDLPAVPDAWREVLLHPEVDENAPEGMGIEQWSTTPDGALSREDKVALRAALSALGSRKSGNSTTFKATRIIFHDYGLSIDDGWPYLCEWNERCGAPHLPHELERKVMNAAEVDNDPAYGQRGRSRKSIRGEARIARAGLNDGPAPAPMTPILSSIATRTVEQMPEDSFRAGYEVVPPALAALIAAQPAPLTTPEETENAEYLAILARAIDDVSRYQQTTGNDADERPYFITAAQLFARSDKPPAWTVEGLIVEGGIAVVATEPKSAKTWIATEIAVAVATGTKACGRFDTRPGAVAYFYTEDMEASIKARLRSLLVGRGLTIDAVARTFHSQPRGREIDVTKLEDCARIIASARALATVGGPIKVLVLDPLRNVHTGEEDKADAMSGVFRHLRMIGTLLNCTILIVHHAAKASENTKGRRPGQRMRGSGAIHGFIDSGIYLEDLKTPDSGTFTNTVRSEVKAARSAGVFELTLKIIDDPITHSAVKATWQTNTIGGTDATPEKVASWREVALDIVDAFYANKIATGSTSMKQREIKTRVKGKSDTLTLALQTATQEGWLRQDRRLGTYHIAPAGEAISRERNTVVTTPTATGEHPAAKFLE